MSIIPVGRDGNEKWIRGLESRTKENQTLRERKTAKSGLAAVVFCSINTSQLFMESLVKTRSQPISVQYWLIIILYIDILLANKKLQYRHCKDMIDLKMSTNKYIFQL